MIETGKEYGSKSVMQKEAENIIREQTQKDRSGCSRIRLIELMNEKGAKLDDTDASDRNKISFWIIDLENNDLVETYDKYNERVRDRPKGRRRRIDRIVYIE